MNQPKIALTLLIVLYASLSQGKIRDNCAPTKATMNDYEPAIFEPSNNLLRRAGNSEIFCGKKIIIHGRILDQNCAPVSDAKVYIWQSACNGKYPYTPLRDLVDKELIAINPASSFTGNGTATTDNNGEFIFITVYPVVMHDLPPHINLRAEHYMLGNLQTNLNFQGKKPISINNSTLTSTNKNLQNTNIPIYNFEIIMPALGIKNY